MNTQPKNKEELLISAYRAAGIVNEQATEVYISLVSIQTKGSDMELDSIARKADLLYQDSIVLELLIQRYITGRI